MTQRVIFGFVRAAMGPRVETCFRHVVAGGGRDGWRCP